MVIQEISRRCGLISCRDKELKPNRRISFFRLYIIPNIVYYYHIGTVILCPFNKNSISGGPAMKQFLAILLTLCMVCSMLPMAATAEEVLLEEEFRLEEVLPEIEEELIIQEEPAPEELLPEILEGEPLPEEREEEIMAYEADNTFTFKLPNRIVVPPTLDDITSDQMLISDYSLDVLPGGYYYCLAMIIEVEGRHYLMSVCYRPDGTYSHAWLTTYNAILFDYGETLSYSFHDFDPDDLTRRGSRTTIYGTMYTDSDTKIYTNIFEFDDGFLSGEEVRQVCFTDKSSDYTHRYFKDGDQWYYQKNNGANVLYKDYVNTEGIPHPVIEFTGKTLRLWNPAPVTDTNIYNFVLRCYSEALGRTDEEIQADSEGVMYWYNNLKNGLISADYVAYYFIFSPEGAQKGQSNNDFVTMLYRLYMNRVPDLSGLIYWDDLLDSGALTRENVNWWFCASAEWQGIKASYNMK